MNKKLLAAAGVVALLLIVFFVVKGRGGGDDSDILVSAKQGTFQIDIVTTGELEAKNSVKVQGPNGLRAARIWQVKLDHIIDEGSVVKKGDYIAKLDNSELVERLKSQENELQQSLSKYTQTKLDTALELRKARNELVNLKFQVQEKKLVLEQSTYEPPATIKQAEIEVEKAEREDLQANENYKLQFNKAVAQMQEAGAELAEDQNEYDFLKKLSQGFSIMAPEPGMVIYHRDWNGNRIKAGSMIQTWDPTVATLPDLTTMVSKTYVNEVDIRKVEMGQKVQLGLDAFPDKKLTGAVISVANMGEQKPNSDSKVFEVSIQVNESDSTSATSYDYQQYHYRGCDRRGNICSFGVFA